MWEYKIGIEGNGDKIFYVALSVFKTQAGEVSDGEVPHRGC